MKPLTKVQKSAKGEECTAMIEGCYPGPENETVVLAHAPRHHRAGMRDRDTWAAYTCMNCHDRLDGRTDWDDSGIGILYYGGEKCTSAQVGFEKIETWFHAIEKTQAKLIEKGLMVVK